MTLQNDEERAPVSPAENAGSEDVLPSQANVMEDVSVNSPGLGENSGSSEFVTSSRQQTSPFIKPFHFIGFDSQDSET